ncbi:SapB/AmfS family lanthipeptide [Saccharothrix xinjiangensis]|uniref:SapB/AmfS family lanthipeptide n=1 Tax=Saccharothrix xinjiangensis TaxID=204798 RepID=A0ABV9XUX8_9PSEU
MRVIGGSDLSVTICGDHSGLSALLCDD